MNAHEVDPLIIVYSNFLKVTAIHQSSLGEKKRYRIDRMYVITIPNEYRV